MQNEKLQFERETQMLRFDEDLQPPAKIRVVGIGGAGGNAVNRMIEAKIGGVEFIAANTDIQALASSRASIKLQIGAKLTNGLGCGAIPERGRQAALEDTERIIAGRRGHGFHYSGNGRRYGNGCIADCRQPGD